MKGSIYNRLHIPVPCHEDWNKMTPNEQGAFCKSCNKSVYDFTTRNAQEVESIITSLQGQEVCGRFSNHQLAPLPDLVIPLEAIPSKLSPFRRFALAAFIVFGTALFGCVNTYGQKMGKVKLTNRNKEVKPAEESIHVKGEVAYIPNDSDSIVPAKCAKPDDENLLITGDTVLLPEPVQGIDSIEENMSVLGGIALVEDPVFPTPESFIVSLPEPVMLDSTKTYILCTMVILAEEVDPQLVPAVPGDSADIVKVPVIKDAILTDHVTVDTVVNPPGDDPADDRDKNALFAGDGLKPGLKCWPNPSTGPVTFNYEVKKRCDVLLQLYDSNGRMIRTLVDIKGCYNAIYNNSFDLSDLDGGTYTCVLRSGNEVNTTRIVIVK